MKKITYLLAGAALLAACQSQPSYKINVTLPADSRIADSTLVYLKIDDGTRMGKILDSAFVANRAFTFEGVADSIQPAFALFMEPNNPRPVDGFDFYLESGNLNVTVEGEKYIVSGTPMNDIFTAFQKQMAELQKPVMDAYQAMQDTTLSEDERKAKLEAFHALRSEVGAKMEEATKTFIQANIGNAVGHDFFCNSYDSFTAEEQDQLLAALPANLANTKAIQRVKTNIEAERKTAVGQKFIDFGMKTPDGKDLKLSDIVSKNKVTLVDFWASWCGPCRAEMPNVVKAYKDFKAKGLEIVGVSLDSDGEAWKQSIKELKMTWPQMSDLKGWQCEGAALYNVRGIPATVLIAQDGTIIAKNLRGEELGNKLTEILK